MIEVFRPATLRIIAIFIFVYKETGVVDRKSMTEDQMSSCPYLVGLTPINYNRAIPMESEPTMPSTIVFNNSHDAVTKSVYINNY